MVYEPTLTTKDKDDAAAFYILAEHNTTAQIAHMAGTSVERVKALIEAQREGAYSNIPIKFLR